MFTLSLYQVEHWINYKPLFKPISFKLEAGKTCYLRGHNGVGKTTLLQIILGLLPCHAGHIDWQLPTSRKQDRPDALMGYIGHKPGINLQLKVTENIALWHALYQCSDATKQRTTQYLMDFDLSDYPHVYTDNLSAGQQKRLAWVRLLAQHKKIWLLDESFTHLDAHALQVAIHCIQAHTQKGGAVIFTSHQDLSSMLPSDQTLTMAYDHD